MLKVVVWMTWKILISFPNYRMRLSNFTFNDDFSRSTHKVEFFCVLFLRRWCPLALFRGSMCTDGKSHPLTHFYSPLKNSWWRAQMRTQSAEDRVVVAAKKDFHRTAVDFDSDEFLLPISSYFDLRCCEW